MATTIVSKRERGRTTSWFPDKILTDFISGRNKKSLKDLNGKISYRDDYDYKSIRS
ncbi:MAG: hypothetical protein LBE91_09315 [Tannerella sp.]|jgi:hypothetical protein|nr:hypothetical protein [Tannerella sp.]